MHVRARVLPTHVPPAPRGAVLVLHGGASRRSRMMVSPTQLSVLRMVPIAKRIAMAGADRLAVFRVLNSVRGWDTHHTPAHDAVWAMQQLRERFGKALPTCLVGHSLGGRAAIMAADQPEVRSVVAMAPWVHLSDGAAQDLRGRRVLIIHGARDRIADPARSAAVARGLARSASVGYVSVTGGKHAMLSHHAIFDRLAADFAVATLLGDSVGAPLDRVLAGERWVDV